MKVFVTGGIGYLVGRSVVSKLIEHGHDAVLLVRSQHSIKHLESFANRLSFVCWQYPGYCYP